MKRSSSARADRSATRELHLDRLLGRRVVERNGRPMGRLEELRTETSGRDVVVSEYVIGVAGLLERLGVGVKRIFGRRVGGYVARWDQMDISDPDRPRLTCGLDQLRRL